MSPLECAAVYSCIHMVYCHSCSLRCVGYLPFFGKICVFGVKCTLTWNAMRDTGVVLEECKYQNQNEATILFKALMLNKRFVTAVGCRL